MRGARKNHDRFVAPGSRREARRETVARLNPVRRDIIPGAPGIEPSQVVVDVGPFLGRRGDPFREFVTPPVRVGSLRCRDLTMRVVNRGSGDESSLRVREGGESKQWGTALSKRTEGNARGWASEKRAGALGEPIRTDEDLEHSLERDGPPGILHRIADADETGRSSENRAIEPTSKSPLELEVGRASASRTVVYS